MKEGIAVDNIYVISLLCWAFVDEASLRLCISTALSVLIGIPSGVPNAHGTGTSLFEDLNYFPGRVKVVDQSHFFVLSVSLFVSLKSLKLLFFFVNDVNVYCGLFYACME